MITCSLRAANAARSWARLGERVVAAVQLRADARLDEQTLREYVTSQLARYKVPDRIVFVGELPRNSMQKVVKRELLPLFEALSATPEGSPQR